MSRGLDQKLDFDFDYGANLPGFPVRVDEGAPDSAESGHVEQFPGPVPRFTDAESPPDDRPVPERMASLFERLHGRRRVMEGIMRFVDGPTHSSKLEAEVRRLQEHDTSVYNSANYAALLEHAGAIEKVEADGSPFDANAEQQPDIVEVDGFRFLKPVDGKQVYWRITAAGREFLSGSTPLEDAWALIGEEPRYFPVYHKALEFCNVGDGRTAGELDALVNGDPLARSPRRYSMYFIERLERFGAVRWEGKWVTTDLGRQLMSKLAEHSERQVSESGE